LAKVATYTSYDELANFSEDHQFHQQKASYLTQFMNVALKDEDWSVAFKAIDDLRITNKYHPAELAENIDYLAPLIKAAVDNLRSNISKNALTLCNEIYANKSMTGELKYASQLKTFVRNTVPSLLQRTLADKVFINKEAKEALSQCVTNLAVPETLEVLSNEGLRNKQNNMKLTELCYTMFLTAYCKAAPVEVTESTIMLLQLLIEGIESVPRIKKVSVDMLKSLKVRIEE
jgi:hypothetical protein